MIWDKVIPAKLRGLLLAFLFLLPLLHVVRQHDHGTGFTALLFFGPAFDAQALPEVRAVPHPLGGAVGYDGQVYAQLASDPSLRHPGLATALDNPRYRSVRIFLPALAHLLGRGRPAAILDAYALLNLCFFALLLWTFVRFLKPSTVGHYLCLAAAAWSTGTLASVERALTDLPSAALAFLAAALAGGAIALPVFAAALLCRESTVIALFSIAWPRAPTSKALARAALAALAVLLPLTAWVLYVGHIFHGAGTTTPGSLGLPFAGLLPHLRDALSALLRAPGRLALFNLLATLSLLVQCAHLFANPRLDSPFWRMGAPFALLFLCFGPPLFAEQLATARATLPLTFAFNALLVARPGRRFLPWFLAGNAGLAFGACQMAWLLVKP